MDFIDGLNLDNVSTRGAKPFFATGAEVIIGVNTVEEKTGEHGTTLNVVGKVLNTTNEGAELIIRLDQTPRSETKKNMLVGMLAALYGENWKVAAKQNLAGAVGKKVSMIALEAGEFNGNKYQHFTGIRNNGVDAKSDIPF